ncbi:hypothetical protein [Paracoccus sp. (in: a-proteobacteria)]|nr:hypothetical protein [Paracoccus sp. (in: a-proteobacteria)]MDO5369629.1 hypothetical protein [Paracoccus sp. (in: a-proteobacteria)]
MTIRRPAGRMEPDAAAGSEEAPIRRIARHGPAGGIFTSLPKPRETS